MITNSARDLTAQEINEGYEANTGHVIVETFREREVDPVHVPAVICRNTSTSGKDFPLILPCFLYSVTKKEKNLQNP